MKYLLRSKSIKLGKFEPLLYNNLLSLPFLFGFMVSFHEFSVLASSYGSNNLLNVILGVYFQVYRE